MLGGDRCGQAEDYFRKTDNTICLLIHVGIIQAPGVFRGAARVEAIDGVIATPSDLPALFGHLGNPDHPDESGFRRHQESGRISPSPRRGHAPARGLSRIPMAMPRMIDSVRTHHRLRCWHGGSTSGGSDFGADCGAAGSGTVGSARRSGSSASDPVVIGRLDQRAAERGFRGGADSVRRWRVWFSKGGVDGLRASPPPGRTPAKGEWAVAVAEEVLAVPVEDRPNWTLPRLQEEIEKRTEVRISKSRLSMVLRKKGAFAGAAPGTASKAAKTPKRSSGPDCGSNS